MTRWEWEKRLREDRQVDAGLKYVGLMLATFGNVNGADIFPSTATLADACSMSANTVRRHREKLVSAGWLECIRGGGGRGLSNKYRLSLSTKSLTINDSVFPGEEHPQRGETLSNNERVYDSETLTIDAAKPSRLTPVNPHGFREGTSTDQTMDHKDVSAGPRADLAPVPGLTHIEPDPNRRSADAREGDELALEAIQ
jgi:Helix-turn-helix domain